MFGPIDRDYYYYFSPDFDIYENHYSQFNDLVDLKVVKANFVKNIVEKQPKSAKEAKEIYIASLLLDKKVIKASNPHPYHKGLDEEDLTNLHIICAELIDEEIPVENKSMFRRVAGQSIDPLFAHRHVYLKIKNSLD